LNAVSYLPVIVAFWLMRKLPSLPARASGSVGQDLREGLLFVRGERRVQALVALVAAASFFGFPYLTMMPVFARDIFHVGPGGLGGLLALSGGVSVLGALILAARSGKDGKGKLAVTAGLTFAVSLVLFALSGGLALAVPALLAAGWGMVTLIAPVNTLVQSIVPDELRGRVMSLYSLVLLGMMPLGNILVGSLAQAIGTPGAVALSGGALGISIVVVVLMRPEVLKL